MKHEIGEILTPETAKEHIGEMVLVWDDTESKHDYRLRRLLAYMEGGFWTIDYGPSPKDACKWEHAALPAKPKPKLWPGDPVVADGIFACYAESNYFPRNWRLPTRRELESAGYPEEQIEHLMKRWEQE